jgi:hypothetical protein
MKTKTSGLRDRVSGEWPLDSADLILSGMKRHNNVLERIILFVAALATPERAHLSALFAELGRSDPRTLCAILRMNGKTRCRGRVPGAALPTGTDVPRRLARQPDQQSKPAYDLHITIASAAPSRQRPYRLQRCVGRSDLV